MHKKPFNKTIVLASIVLLLVVSTSISTNNLSFAFLGFDFGGSSSSTDQSLGSSQGFIQGAHCYSPDASIVNSCNSGDATASENLGHNTYGQ
jgi:hypothetical protein